MWFASATPTDQPRASSAARFSAARARLSREGTRGSGDDVGREVILDDRDLVLQAQLALLQPGDLQLVLAVRCAERGNRRVEIAVLYPERRQPLAHLLFGHAAHPSWRRVAVFDRFIAGRV